MSLPTFPPFDYAENVHNVAQRWIRWSDKLETMFIAMDIKDPKRMRALLKHYAGDEVLDILATLPDTGDDYEDAMLALNKYFESQHNASYDIFNFRKAEQQAETLDQYVTRLKSLSLTCGFLDPDQEVRNQIILAGKSNKIRRFAIQHPDTDLNSILKHGRACETTDRHVSELEAFSKNNINIIHEHHKKQNRNDFPPEKYKEQQKKLNNVCKFCGDAWHIKGLKFCKAQGKRCALCNKYNHFAKACLSKSNNKNPNHKNTYPNKSRDKIAVTNSIQPEDEDSSSYILSTFSANSSPSKHEMLSLNFKNIKSSFIIDTGATVNVISKHELDKINKNTAIEKCKVCLFAYGSKSPLKLVGKTSLTTNFRGTEHNIEFIVTNDDGPSLIGKSTALELGVINFVNSINSNPDKVTQIVNLHPKLFQGLGKLKMTKVILQIDDTVKPTIQKVRRIPFHLRKKVEQEIEDLLRQDIIEPVPSNCPTLWISPIVPVPKKQEPDKIRICIDMKKANQAIKCEKFITPTLTEVTYQLNGAKHFSKLDLNKGYHQLELEESSRHITTFITHKGLYRYKRLHFGVNTAADIFQHEIMKILVSIPNVLNVSDDILVFGKTQEEHNSTLEAVLNKLEAAGITLNKNKCAFNKTTLKFLGNIFTKEGISPDPDKTDSILKIEEPKNPSEIRSFLGTINFCAKHIPQLAITAKPLRLLTKHNTKWKWSQEHHKAFIKLKQQIAEATRLAYFDRQKETEIWTDAGPEGLGAILIQRDKNNSPYTIAFASHSLTDTEQRYSQIEKEALALTWATRHFHLFIYGSKFKIVTDHKPLLYLYNNTDNTLSSRLERWRIKLMPYNYVIDYKPGKNNPADYLSRHPLTKNTKGTTSTKLAEVYVNFIAKEATPKHLTLQKIKEHTRLDKTLSKVINNLYTNNWNKNQYEEDSTKMKAFYKMKHELATIPSLDILLRGARIVLPDSLCKETVKIAHSGHQGITRMKELLREKLWFPGMDNLVEKEVKSCIWCQASSNNKDQYTPTLSEVPDGPWRDINIDHKGPLPSGEYLLVIVDKYSKFPVVERVSSTAARQNISKLDSIFATFGIPNKVTTDNGAPFNSHNFKDFMNSLGIEHQRIIPRWPQQMARSRDLIGS